ncbi:MAG: branched-chain amino acid ABC transporter permease [Candidatus Bathyarchaeia archaeon]
MITPSLLFHAFINGLILGGLYALVALGINLIYGVMRIVNFAHGEFLMVGMYVAYWLFMLYGIHPYVSIPMIILVVVVLAVATERLLIEPVLKDPEINQLLITAALSVFLQNIALFFWKADYRGIPIELHPLTFAGVTIGFMRLNALIVALPTSFIFYLFLMKTGLGRSIRAVAQDREIAELMGISVRRVYTLTFGLSALLIGIGAAIIIPVYYVFPLAGFSFGLMAWIIIVFGGLGSYEGAFIGALVLGVVEAITGVVTNAELARAFAFAIFIGVLIFRPEGLLGKRARV